MEHNEPDPSITPRLNADQNSLPTEHRLVRAVEAALGWSDASCLGKEFTRGHLADEAQVTGKAPMTGEALCRRLLTPSRLLDMVTRRSLEPPQLRCFQNGVELHPAVYLATRVGRRGQRTRLADTNKLAELLESGLTLIFDALDTFDATMEVACRAFQWWSHELVQVNAYLTTGSAAGFPLHWDDHDVIVIQLFGEKAWDIRSFSRPVPMYRDATPNSTPSEKQVWAGVLRVGDVIHIPRGHWHKATRADLPGGSSLHVTFGFPQQTGVDWLAWIADQAREFELFRRDLARGGNGRERTEQDRALADAAAGLLRSRPPAEFLAHRERLRPPRRHAPPLPAGSADSADAQPSVVCITEFSPEFAEDGEHVSVLGGGKKLTFKKKARPALDRLLSGTPVDVAEVGAQAGTDARALADLLVREGLCVGLTPELFSGYTGLTTGADCWKAPST